jgi:hypothetical protein
LFVANEQARTLQDWLDEQKVLPSALAVRCGCHRARITEVLKGREPNEHLRKALYRETKLESFAEGAPASEKRPVAELPELKGTPAERARTLETWLEARARSGHGLSLDLDRSVRALLSSIQAQVRAKPIPDLHEHPDWNAFITLVLDAVGKYPGAARAIIDAIRSALPREAEAA